MTGPFYPSQSGNATYNLTMYAADLHGNIVASEPIRFSVGLYPPNSTPIMPDWSKLPPGPWNTQWNTPTPTPKTSGMFSPNLLIGIVAVSAFAIVTLTLLVHRKRSI